MSGSKTSKHLLTTALPAVADELTDLALEVAALGEDLSSDTLTPATRIQAMQKFDALSQALGAFAHVLRGLGHGHPRDEHDAMPELLEKIPFFDVRERLRSKILPHSTPTELASFPDDIWFEC